MPTKDIAPTPAMERILCEAIYPFNFVTQRQITRLLYSPGSLNGVGRLLGKLVEGKYLDRFYLPTGFNLRPYIYMLGERGKEYFRVEKEWDVPKLPTLATMQTRSNSFLMHLLEVNNVIIAAKLLEKYNQDVHLIRFEHDITLRKNPLVATTQAGKKVSVAPDATIEIEASGRRVLWIEVERGTNNERYILTKMHDIYDVFDRRVFQERVGTNRCRVCYMTTAGVADVVRLHALAEQVLSARLGSNAPVSKRCLIYNIMAIPAMGVGDIDVAATFLRRSWLHPFHAGYDAILDVG